MNQNAINILITAKDMASGVLGGVGGAIKGVGSVALGIAGTVAKSMAVVGTAVAGFTGIVIKNTSDLEQNTIAFTAMLRSGDKAKKLLDDLAKFGKETPFELSELQDVTKQLLAYGFAQEKIIPLLTTVGNISAGVGKDKMPVLIRALGQIRAKGKLAGQEFLQLTETGLPIADALAKRLNISTQELTGNVADLNISYETVEATIKDIEKKQFNNLMAKQAQSLSGIWSNIKDTITVTTQQIGMQTGLFEFIKSTTSDILDFVVKTSPYFIEIVKNAGQFLGQWGNEAGQKFAGQIGDLTSRFGELKDSFKNLLNPSTETKKALKDLFDTGLSNILSVLSGKNGLVAYTKSLIDSLSKPETIEAFAGAIDTLSQALKLIKPILQTVELLIKSIVAGINVIGSAFGIKGSVKATSVDRDKAQSFIQNKAVTDLYQKYGVSGGSNNFGVGNLPSSKSTINNYFNNTTVDPNVLSSRLNYQLGNR